VILGVHGPGVQTGSLSHRFSQLGTTLMHEHSFVLDTEIPPELS